MVKSADGLDQTVIPFKPNRAQRRLMARLWYRNLILKARQLGFTTLICILWLDHALFNENQRVGIVAQDRETAEALFRDKVKLAYENLPEEIRAVRKLKRETAQELLFDNNSSIRVATSVRGGTIHRLHISEFGKIGAKYPEKAAEVVTGSLPAVPLDGIAVIESTAEGQDGEFYRMSMRAIEKAEGAAKLTPRDWRLHFYAWWMEPGYRMSEPVPISPRDEEYFKRVEGETGTTLDRAQRNWYVATRDADFSGDEQKMWQEYPSFPREAFQVSTEGTYYAVQLAWMRKNGRITSVPFAKGSPVNTFWDIGNTDGTAIWFHQRIGMEDRFINFVEGWGESYGYFVKQMQDYSAEMGGIVWGTHYLPHDAAHKRQQGHGLVSPEDELRKLAIGGTWRIVPRVSSLIDGIQKTRDAFATAWIDETRCKDGIVHLTKYRKVWDRAKGGWKIGEANKVEGHSEAADAFRQWAQGFIAPPAGGTTARRERNWRVA